MPFSVLFLDRLSIWLSVTATAVVPANWYLFVPSSSEGGGSLSVEECHLHFAPGVHSLCCGSEDQTPGVHKCSAVAMKRIAVVVARDFCGAPGVGHFHDLSMRWAMLHVATVSVYTPCSDAYTAARL